MLSNLRHFRTVFWWVIIAVLLVACGTENRTPVLIPSPSSTNLAQQPTDTITPTPFQPSPTPVPIAAKVNGEAITMAEFQAELLRYQAALVEDTRISASDAENQVLNDLINQVILAQAARENGFVLDQASLAEKMDQLVEKSGGQGSFSEWLATHGYTEDSFREAFARSLASAWMRDQILAKLPDQAEQVHARQILLYNSDQAEEVIQQLESGSDFATLAATYNPSTSGDLGWFPRGYLRVPALEEAAFSLQSGEYSDIIASDLGYHILQVLERDPNRSLDPGARRVFKEKALQDWLEMQRNQSEIVILLPER